MQHTSLLKAEQFIIFIFCNSAPFYGKNPLSWKPQVQSTLGKRFNNYTKITDEHQCNVLFTCSSFFTAIFTKFKVFEAEPPLRNGIKCPMCLSEITHMQHGKGHEYWDGIGMYVSQRIQEMLIYWRLVS